jgi:UDP-glucose 4-epimerase
MEGCKTYMWTDGKSDKELIGHIGFGEPVEVDSTQHKKILITGAGSYIGEYFKSYANEHYPTLEIYTLDMKNPKWKEKVFSHYDIVYHVAGIAHADVGKADEATKKKYYAVNTDLAVETCKKAKSEGVKEFIFMSSMIVYGDSAPYGRKKIIDEHTVPKPANFYGDSKLQADVAVRSFADDNFKVIVLRPPMIYGKGSKGNYRTLVKLAKKMPLFPNVENKRSMLYIENLCEFLCQIMLVKEIKENAVVLMPQNPEWTSTSEMIKDIADSNGKKMYMLNKINWAVWIASKLTGKIGRMVNTSFGNICYVQKISDYHGVKYKTINLKESIKITEG